jgi:mRNA capping enzyme/mRNA capping enzyme, catalytic domain
LNNVFKGRDEDSKKAILTKYPKKEIQIEILENIDNPALQNLYNNLSEQKKKQLDMLGIRDKYIILKQTLEKKQKNQTIPQIEKKIYSPKSPEGPPPDLQKKVYSPHSPEVSPPDLQKKVYSPHSPEVSPPDMPKDAPQEIFNVFKDEREIEVEEDKKITPPKAFDNLVKTFYSRNPYMNPASEILHYELEVKFGTKGIKFLTKNDYDNVIKVLKSFGFTTENSSGLFSLRAKCEFLDSSTGNFKMSNIRTEINGLTAIEKYCKSNDIKTIYKEQPNSVKFNSKNPYNEHISSDSYKPKFKKIRPVDFDDFNFRVSLQIEEKAKKGIEYYIMENWKKSKKEFRYLNRVTFTHPDYPVLVDISILKSGNKSKDKRGFSYIIPVYNLDESNVFNNQESYEIEIEVDNTKIGPGTQFQTPDLIVAALRKVIRFVLSGLQGTMYPVSYPEQQEILRDYMKMIWKDEYEPSRYITSANFIGPNSITLQLTNIAPLDDNSTIPNIRKDFVVTDKADGDRHLMYISKTGKIYLISTNMDIKFTGSITKNENCFNTLLDGELITHDKKGNYINLYAAFDIYFYKNKDVRDYPFISYTQEQDAFKCRYRLLDNVQHLLEPSYILEEDRSNKSAQEKMKTLLNAISPIKFEIKKFYPISTKQTIFEGCKTILEKEKEGLFVYETDGLIFTHATYGVGSNIIGKAGPKTKITWEYSFKWKPPQFNTIDFLVTTTKTQNGDDVIKSLFEDGINSATSVQYSDYKVIELRCGFSEKNDGFINPCQDIIDDNLPSYNPRFEDRKTNDYMPKRFYPTEPYNPNAGICNIMLKLDESGSKQMFTKEGEVFKDNTIVEFAYDLDAEEGWRWVPLRVRYDKTGKLLRGEREYGNSYKVANENWKSIHPSGRITDAMLSTGLDIPEVSVSEDVYYNTPAGKMKTEALKNFHNLYVKKTLINGTTKQGDTLIDFACGKAGDLPKWISSKLSFVFGIDYSKDNLENRIDGACVRYLKSRIVNKHVPNALFAHGNSAFNIRDGSAMLNDKAKQITASVFGNGPKEADKIGKGVAKQYGKGDSGFNVSSCQFAIHYFFETPDTLRGFLRNIAECTKLNGYFIGTSYDGKMMFNELKKIKTGDSAQIVDEGKKIWEVIKQYGADNFDDDSSSIGYRIDVFQESINQYISEYLVNYDYLNRLMDAYGFKIIEKEEANQFGLPNGSGLFSELFMNMLDEIKRNKFKESLYRDAPYMTSFEKKISFFNRYFVYKKIREVNIDKLQIELGEYEEAVVKREKEETNKAVVVAKEEEKKIKPKIRKLSKKIALIPATEANDSNTVKVIEEEIEKQAKKRNDISKKGNIKKGKKLLIIESDED